MPNTLIKMPTEITIPVSLTYAEFQVFKNTVKEVLKRPITTSEQNTMGMHKAIVDAFDAELARQMTPEPTEPGSAVKAHLEGGDERIFVLTNDRAGNNVWLDPRSGESVSWEHLLITSWSVETVFDPSNA